MSKQYTVVGVSEFNGECKVRYANSTSRARVLERNGHTNVVLYELELASHKMDCVDAMLDVLDAGEHDLSAVQVEAIRNEARELGFVL
jgi:hypothetical protein